MTTKTETQMLDASEKAIIDKIRQHRTVASEHFPDSVVINGGEVWPVEMYIQLEKLVRREFDKLRTVGTGKPTLKLTKRIYPRNPYGGSQTLPIGNISEIKVIMEKSNDSK